MLAISVRQPWAWAILHAGKTIENRSWAPTYRGLLLLHVSKNRRAKSDLRALIEALFAKSPEEGKRAMGKFEKVPLGAVVGFCYLDEVLAIREELSHDELRWAAPAPSYYWRLSAPRALTRPIACNGRLGLWTPPAEAVASVIEELDAHKTTPPACDRCKSSIFHRHGAFNYCSSCGVELGRAFTAEARN